MYVMSSQGTHVRYFRAVDNAGNVSSSLAKYAYIDTTAPTCGSVTNASTSWRTTAQTITQACSDNLSGCASKLCNGPRKGGLHSQAHPG